MNFTTILTFINILTMGAVGVGFVYNKTEAAKFDPAPVIERVAGVESKQAVNINRLDNHDKLFEKIDKTLERMETKIDDIGGWNKPAVVPPNAPLVKGVNKDGSPQQ